MSQVVTQVPSRREMDPYEIGWYVESADEETYGPVSRNTLVRWLEETGDHAEHAGPPLHPGRGRAAGGPGRAQGPTRSRSDQAGGRGPPGRRLAPQEPRSARRWRRARSPAPGTGGPRPSSASDAMLPYCGKCQMKPLKKQFFLCRRCQASIYNRRVGALMLDTLLLIYVPMIAVGIVVGLLGLAPESFNLVVNVLSLAPCCCSSSATRSSAGPARASG